MFKIFNIFGTAHCACQLSHLICFLIYIYLFIFENPLQLIRTCNEGLVWCEAYLSRFQNNYQFFSTSLQMAAQEFSSEKIILVFCVISMTHSILALDFIFGFSKVIGAAIFCVIKDKKRNVSWSEPVIRSNRSFNHVRQSHI